MTAYVGRHRAPKSSTTLTRVTTTAAAGVVLRDLAGGGHPLRVVLEVGDDGEDGVGVGADDDVAFGVVGHHRIPADSRPAGPPTTRPFSSSRLTSKETSLPVTRRSLFSSASTSARVRGSSGSGPVGSAWRK